jgi:hypothetical protein
VKPACSGRRSFDSADLGSGRDYRALEPPPTTTERSCTRSFCSSLLNEEAVRSETLSRTTPTVTKRSTTWPSLTSVRRSRGGVDAPQSHRHPSAAKNRSPEGAGVRSASPEPRSRWKRRRDDRADEAGPARKPEARSQPEAVMNRPNCGARLQESCKLSPAATTNELPTIIRFFALRFAFAFDSDSFSLGQQLRARR